MGDSLVSLVPTDPGEYQKWLQAQRDFYAKWDDFLQQLRCIRSDTLLNNTPDKSLEHVWDEAFDERLESREPTYHAAFPNGWGSIEYIYTIDLDLEVFSIDNSAHYRLSHIPRNDAWIDALCWEKSHKAYRLPRRFVMPQLVPAESIASLAVENTNFTSQALQFWDSLPRKQVTVKVPAPSIGSSIRLKIFKIYQRRQADNLSLSLLSWTADDLPFREIAFFILCLAIGGDYLAIVDEHRILRPRWSANFAAMLADDEPDCPRELVSSVAAGYHMQGEPVGSAPNASKYWLGGALICLVPRLREGDNVKKAIADAIQHGRNQFGRTSFNAILLSIRDVLFLRSFPNGTVEYSEILPLMGTRGSSGMSAEQRFTKEWLDQEYECHKAKKTEEKGPDENKGITSAADIESDQVDLEDESVKSEPVEMCEDEVVLEQNENESERRNVEEEMEEDLQSEIGGEAGEEDGEESEYQSVTEDSWTLQDTFLSLIHFFEATTLESLKPTISNGRNLPPEIVKMILDHVTDLNTYKACERVSRSFRSICHQRPLLMDNIALSDVPLGTDRVGTDNPSTTKNRTQIKYRATRLLSGQYMDIHLPTSKSEDEVWGFHVVVGLEWNRKSFSPGCIIEFAGLHKERPWAEVATPDSERSEERVSTSNTYWDRAMRSYDIEAYCDTQSLGQFWSEGVASKVFQHESLLGPLRKFTAGEWLLPPNTGQYFGTFLCFDHKEIFHFFFLRIKRASRFRDEDELWKDIIDEAKASLSSPNLEPHMNREDRSKDIVVGAGDPLVLLNVGLKVRLFDWRQGFDKSVTGYARKVFSPFGSLVERDSGRVYSITNTEDREVMDAFFKEGAERLKAARAANAAKLKKQQE